MSDVDPNNEQHPSPVHHISPRHLLQRVQDRIARAVGLGAEARSEIVVDMIDHHAKLTSTYWIQLVISAGLSTLGLALGSSAVVIGAMLISPLMGPIVHLGMALAVGSPYLAMRSSTRVAASVVVVVIGGAVITILLPFHEMNREILSRTTPNALDLVVAIFCAAAAAYSTVQHGGSAGVTAAGTAIGIALVPPLSVAGFGIGTRQPAVMSGAALLFTTNLCAILLVTALIFFVLGFGQVDVFANEQRLFDSHARRPATVRAARWMSLLFTGRYSAVPRFALPLALVGAVYLPLEKALTEVTWQVRSRAAVDKILRGAVAARGAVQSTVRVDGHRIMVRLVVLGDTKVANGLEEQLRAEIDRTCGVASAVEVVAVPDLPTLERALVLSDRVHAVQPPLPLLDAEEIRRRTARTLGEVWPAEAVGPLLSWRVIVGKAGPPTVELVHMGMSLGPGAQALLARNLSAGLGTPVEAREERLATQLLRVERGHGADWIPHLDRALDALGRAEGLHACVELPLLPPAAGGGNHKRPPKPTDDARAIEESRLRLARVPAERVRVTRGSAFSILLTLEDCPPTGIAAAAMP